MVWSIRSMAEGRGKPFSDSDVSLGVLAAAPSHVPRLSILRKLFLGPWLVAALDSLCRHLKSGVSCVTTWAFGVFLVSPPLTCHLLLISLCYDHWFRRIQGSLNGQSLHGAAPATGREAG